MTNFKTRMNEEITTIIKEMNLDEQFYLFRQYCEEVNYCDDMPERVDDINELFDGMKPLKILDKLEGLNTSWNCWNYFCFNGYGNVEEWEGIDFVSEVVDYIIANEDALYNGDIQEVLDKYSETEELYIEKKDFDKVVHELESQEIPYEYDEEETDLKIFNDDYDIVTDIFDELEIEY